MHAVVHSGGRASAADIKLALRPLAETVLADLKKLGHSIVLSQAQELVAAGFGFYKFQLMLRSGANLVSRPLTHGDDHHSQYRPMAVERRASEILAIRPEAAMTIGAAVVHHMRASGLVIDTLEAYRRDDGAGHTILSALAADHTLYPPVNATVAIRAGLIPPPPTILTLRKPDQLGRMGSGEALLLEAMQKRKLYVLRSPSPEIGTEAAMSSTDEFKGLPLSRVEAKDWDNAAALGFGFTLVQKEDMVLRTGPAKSFTFHTPVVRRRKAGGWNSEWRSNGYIIDGTDRRRRFGLPERVHIAVDQLNVARFCQKCRQIYADGELDCLAHSGCTLP